MGEPPTWVVVPEVLQMEETDFVIVEGVVVPESVLLRAERENKYGSVPGLDDEELADPDELERQVFLEAFAPVLMLPRPRSSGCRPDIDEHFGVDWGAFGTVDFDRFRPSFDRVQGCGFIAVESRHVSGVKCEACLARLLV